MTIQQDVCAAVRDRGYLAGWTTEQAIARQVCKLQEELAELACEVNGLDPETAGDIQQAGRQARIDFDGVDGWHDAAANSFGYSRRAAAELYDLQVVVFVLAELLGVDVQAGALDKARADVERGKRNGANGQ